MDRESLPGHTPTPYRRPRYLYPMSDMGKDQGRDRGRDQDNGMVERMFEGKDLVPVRVWTW